MDIYIWLLHLYIFVKKEKLKNIVGQTSNANNLF